VRSHVAFLNLPAHGHVRPTLPLVSELVARGHRVTYAVGEEYAEVVAGAGAEPVPYRSPLAGRPTPTEMTPDVIAEVPLTYLRENIAAMEVCPAALERDRPDLVLYDTTMFAAGRILSRSLGVPAIRTFPTFAQHERFSVDQLAGPRYGVDPRHPKFTEFFLRLVQLLADHGMAGADVGAFLGEVEPRNLVFLPRRAQLAEETFDDRFEFVGPCLDPDAERGGFEAPPGDGPLVLISLGSAFNDRPDFFRDCAAAFAGQPERVLLALGKSGVAASLGPLPPNVVAHPWLPLHAVLEQTSVCVTHGGFGTSLMALHYRTPLLCVPQHVENDFVAERLGELGVAQALKPADVTPESLRAAIRRVLADDAQRERVARFSDEMATGGGVARAADVVEESLRVRG
jgi:calicheamicin 4-deoxy-4-thio-alpha-D-digitoxosyltransferase